MLARARGHAEPRERASGRDDETDTEGARQHGGRLGALPAAHHVARGRDDGRRDDLPADVLPRGGALPGHVAAADLVYAARKRGRPSRVVARTNAARRVPRNHGGAIRASVMAQLRPSSQSPPRRRGPSHRSIYSCTVADVRTVREVVDIGAEGAQHEHGTLVGAQVREDVLLVTE